MDNSFRLDDNNKLLYKNATEKLTFPPPHLPLPAPHGPGAEHGHPCARPLLAMVRHGGFKLLYSVDFHDIFDVVQSQAISGWPASSHHAGDAKAGNCQRPTLVNQAIGSGLKKTEVAASGKLIC